MKSLRDMKQDGQQTWKSRNKKLWPKTWILLSFLWENKGNTSKHIFQSHVFSENIWVFTRPSWNLVFFSFCQISLGNEKKKIGETIL